MTPPHLYSILTLCLMAVLVTIVSAQDYNIEENVKELLARRKNLEFMRQLVEDMDDQFSRLQKRTCYYNAGMSHNCDYREMNKDMNDETSWNQGPGKRKRSASTSEQPQLSGKDGIRSFLKSLAANNRKLR